MPNSGEKIEKIEKDHNTIKYLEPIPVDSFIRHQLLRLFANVGLEDFQSQILLSIVLHGGQIKPITLAKDIRCNPTRLELPDGFPSLLELKLIAMSHTRPKTVILALGIDDFLERLATRTIIPNYFLSPRNARDLLVKLDQFCLSFENDHPDEKKNDYLTNLLEYYKKLELLSNKIPSLLSLIYFTLSSLWMNQNEAIILAKLIACGGRSSKKRFFIDYMKKIDQNILFDNSRSLEEDYKLLGYEGNILKNLVYESTAFFKQRMSEFQFSSEQQFNMILNCLQNFSQTTSMGKKEKKRKFKYLVLTTTLTQLADFLYQSIIDFKVRYNSELKILKMAYSNVKLVDRDIFLSSIADPSSTRKRLETDLKYAVSIYLVLIHSYFVEDIFLKIFDSDNMESKVNVIVAEEQKDSIINMLKAHKVRIEGKRGITTADTITFTPSNDIPQDVLIGNTIILFYNVGSSMITIHEEITKSNPTEINTIPNDVDLALKCFNEIKNENQEKSTAILSLIDKGGK